MNRKKVIAAGAAAILLAAPLSVRKINDLFGTRVDRVIDGDTFRTNTGQRIRLLGVNAPEMGLCLSEEAKNRLTKLIEGKRVIIREPYVDYYGRVVALVYYGEKLINEELLDEGLGRYESEKTSEKERLKEVSDRAKKGKKGVYGSVCSQEENTTSPKCRIKGNIDGSKKIYHLPECNAYQLTVVELDKGDRWFCSEKEAVKAGFIKSLNCK